MASVVSQEGPFNGPMGSYVRVWYDDGSYQDVLIPQGPGGTPAGQMSAGTASGTISVDDAGNIVQPPPSMAAPAPSGASGQLGAGIPTSSPRDVLPSEAPQAGDSYGGGYSRSSGGYRGRGSGSGYSDYGGGYEDDPFSNIPPYQNGQLHPAAGGEQLVAGGPFAAQDDGYDDRQQVWVPDGAAAGPVETRSAPTPRSDMSGYGGGSSWSDEGRQGGGGGDTRGVISSIRGRILGNLAGGGSDSYSSDTSSNYRKTGRLADRYYAELEEGMEPRVHGWAKRQRFKPGSIDAALADPTMILPAVFDDYQANNTLGDQQLRGLPMTDLALTIGGTRSRRGMSTRTPMPRFPNALRQAGYEESEPANKRILDPSDVVNTMRDLYLSIGQQRPDTGGTWFDTGELLGNLAGTRKQSIVGQQLRDQAKLDPGGSMESAKQFVRSSLSTLPGSAHARGLLNSVDLAATNLGPSALRRKPKQAHRMLRSLADVYQ